MAAGATFLRTSGQTDAAVGGLEMGGISSSARSIGWRCVCADVSTPSSCPLACRICRYMRLASQTVLFSGEEEDNRRDHLAAAFWSDSAP